ncbi:MAG: LCP family protein [Faecalibacterium sp.]
MSHQHHNHRHKHLHRRDVIRAAAVALVLAVVLAALGLYIRSWETKRFATGSDEISSGVIAAPQPRRELTYKGVTYRERTGLESYLLIGVDRSGEATSVNSYEGGGQADVQMLLVVDNEAKTWQVLQINRDSMVKVPILAVNGQVFSYATQQIALAHYYGDGREQSCENTVRAVSRMLEDQPINGYLAVHLDAVGIITDLVGGVTLTVTSDFSAIDPSLVMGETINLSGEQALTYVRSRFYVDDQTNIARMARQRQYLTALEEKLRQKDEKFVLEAYDTLSSYMVTDIASGTASIVFDSLKQYTQLEMLTIAGDNRVENGHWAYYLDEDSLQQTILQLFYEQAK